MTKIEIHISDIPAFKQLKTVHSYSIFPTFNSKLFLLFSSRLSSVPLQLLVPAIRAFPGHSYGRHHWFCYDSTSLFEGQTATATGHRRKVSSVSEVNV